MSPTPVDPATNDIRFTSTGDLIPGPSAVHVGGGVFLTSHHGSSGSVTQAAGLTAERANVQLVTYDYTLPQNTALWPRYDDADGDILAGFDQSVAISRSQPYDGPAARMLIAADPEELSGTVTISGYPGSAGGQEFDTGSMLPGAHQTEFANGDTGGYFDITGLDANKGMSGGGLFLEQVLPDGSSDSFLIGTIARTAGVGPLSSVQATSISAHYAALADTLQAAGVDADTIANPVLLAAQTPGSGATTVAGTYLNEDIYGGPNADTLSGAQGRDAIFGGGGADRINGGAGNDHMEGGAGGDLFAAGSFGGGARDLIADFDTARDTLEVGPFFSSVSQVRAAASETSGGNTVIHLPDGGRIVLRDVSRDDLGPGNLSFACFLAGTLVNTPKGPRAVETLAEGDPVCTRDGGTAPLLWIGRTKPVYDPDLAPVEIMTHSFGPGCPTRPVRLSPDHRVMLAGAPALALFGAAEVLVTARALLAMPTVVRAPERLPAVYVHLLFDRHELVCTASLWSESFCPAVARDDPRSAATLSELTRLFPGRFGPYAPQLATARPALTPAEADILLSATGLMHERT